MQNEVAAENCRLEGRRVHVVFPTTTYMCLLAVKTARVNNKRDEYMDLNVHFGDREIPGFEAGQEQLRVAAGKSSIIFILLAIGFTVLRLISA